MARKNSDEMLSRVYTLTSIDKCCSYVKCQGLISSVDINECCEHIFLGGKSFIKMTSNGRSHFVSKKTLKGNILWTT